MGLLCLLGFHSAEETECKCKKCGKEIHDLDISKEWRPEGGTDRLTRLEYHETEYEISQCKKCDYKTEAPTGYVRE